MGGQEMDKHVPDTEAQAGQGSPPPGPGSAGQPWAQPPAGDPHTTPGQQWAQGTPGTQPAYGQHGTAPGVPKKSNPKLRRRLIIGGSIAAGLLVILVVGGFFTVRQLSQTVYSPKVEVEQYLQAIVDGDVEAALAMLPGDGAEGYGLDYALMSNEVYAKVENRIDGFEVTKVEYDGFVADVSAEVSQGDSAQPMTFSLYEDGTEAVFFKKWELQAPQERWSISYFPDSNTSAATVNGVEIEVPEDGASFAVLPGDYVFDAPEGNQYVSYGAAEERSIRLADTEPASGAEPVSFSSEITDAAREEIKAQTKAHLAACLKSTELQPKGCPNQADGEDPNNFRNIKWTMTKEPAYAGIDGDPSFPFPVTAENGQFLLEAEMKQGGSWGPQKGTVELYSMPAMVEIRDGKISMVFSD